MSARWPRGRLVAHPKPGKVWVQVQHREDIASDWIEVDTEPVAEAEFHIRQLTEARDRAERRAEALEAVLAEVRRVFDLQCPPMSAENYVDRGAYYAHCWWDNVLGDILRRAESA